MEKYKKYDAKDILLLRAPLKQIENIKNIDGDKIWNVVNDDTFIESVLLASLNTYKSVVKFKETGKAGKGLKETLLKYYDRAVTRTTPYGLFCLLAIGQFSDEECERLEITKQNLTKVCEVDLGWLYGVIKNLETDINVLKKLFVKYNTICYEKGDKVRNAAKNYYGQNTKINEANYVESSTICNSLNVKKIIEWTQEFISVEEIIKRFKTQNSNTDIKKIEKFIQKLVEEEYLITDLRPPLNNPNQLDYVVSKLQNVSDIDLIIDSLYNIRVMLREYENQAIGEGIQQYLNLINTMKTVYEFENYISVSVGIVDNIFNIDSCIKKDLVEFANFLSELIVDDNEDKEIIYFKDKFIERYGADGKVQLQEALDSEKGIGNPYQEAQEKSYHLGGEKNNAILQCVKNEMILAVKKGEKEILLDQTNIREIAQKYQSVIEPSFSFELNIMVEKERTSRKYNIYIAPNKGSYKAGDCFNRFTSLLKKDNLQKLNEMYKEEISETENDYRIVNVNEILKAGSSNNICVGSMHYNTSLNLGYPPAINDMFNIPTSEIDMKDLYIKYNMRTDRLYIINKKTKEIVKFVSDNMLNPMGNCYLTRFLIEVSMGYNTSPIDILLNLEEMIYAYRPRIKFKNIVIAEERWILNYDEKSMNTFDSFQRYMKKYSIDWGLPDKFYCVNLDRRIVIDWKNNDLLNIMYRVLQKNKIVCLSSLESKSYSDPIIRDGCGKYYYSELVVPFQRVDKSISYFKLGDNQKNIVKDYYDNYSSERVVLPGDKNWIYYKIYCDRNRVDELLGKYLKEFTDRIIDDINQWFFIRYSDFKFHIRLRIQAKNQESFYRVLKSYACWYDKIKAAGISYKYAVEPYYREIERYGNFVTIKSAETHFWKESQLNLLISNEILNNQIFNKKEYAVWLCYKLMLCFCYTEFQMEELLESLGIERPTRQEINDYRRYEICLRKEEIKYISKETTKQLEEWCTFLINYRRILSDFIWNDPSKLFTTKDDITLSLLHMLCNRFSGDRIWEREIYSILRYCLHKKNCSNKFKKSRFGS